MVSYRPRSSSTGFLADTGKPERSRSNVSLESLTVYGSCFGFGYSFYPVFSLFKTIAPIQLASIRASSPHASHISTLSVPHRVEDCSKCASGDSHSSVTKNPARSPKSARISTSRQPGQLVRNGYPLLFQKLHQVFLLRIGA